MKLPIRSEALRYTFNQNGMRGTSSTFRETKNTYKALVRYMTQEISGRPSGNWRVWTLIWFRIETSDELL